MKDIDAIVQRFSEAEDANFSLFNYVNEVNAEVEKLEEQIAEIKVCCALHAVLDPILQLSLSVGLHWPGMLRLNSCKGTLLRSRPAVHAVLCVLCCHPAIELSLNATLN